MSNTIRNLAVLAAVAVVATPLALAQEVSPDDRDLLWARGMPPNVLMILDSGATMAYDPETNGEGDTTQTPIVRPLFIANGDDPGSKLYQAKDVIADFVLTFPAFNMGFTYYEKEAIGIEYTNFIYQVSAGQPSMLDGTPSGGQIRMGGILDVKNSSDKDLPLIPIRFGPDGAAPYVVCLTAGCDKNPKNGDLRVESCLVDASGVCKVAGAPPYYYPAYDWTGVSATTQGGIAGASWSAIAAAQGLDLADPTWQEAVRDFALADVEYQGSPWGAGDLEAWKASALSNQVGSEVLRIREQVQVFDGGNWLPSGDPQVTAVEFVQRFVLYDRPWDEGTNLGNAKGTLVAVDFQGSKDCNGYMEFSSTNKVPIVPIPQWDDPNPSFTRRWIASFMQPQPTSVFYFPNFPGADSDPFLGYQPKVRTSWIPLTETVIAAGRRPIKDTLNELEFHFLNDLANREDPYKMCRDNFAILVTDGRETCANDNTCCVAATDLGKKGVKVYVIGFGPGDLANEPVLQCVAANTGTGSPYIASDSAALARTLREIGRDIEARVRGFASPVVPTVQSSTDQMAYIASFTPAGDRSIWTGELYAYLIDPLTGTIPLAEDPMTGAMVPDKVQALWKAHEELETRTASDRSLYYGDASGPGLAIPASRFPFAYTGDGGANDTRLRNLIRPALTDVELETTVDFIRGDRDVAIYEGLKLGDIFHSTPVVYGRPACYTCYLNDQSGYRTGFRALHSKRRQVVFVGANDGTLHAFDAALWDTGVNRYDYGSGAELFAWVPRAVMPTLDDIAFDFEQKWTVDGPATVADVYVDPSIPAGGSPVASEREWRSLLLFGERQGGRSVVVLDVTQPDPVDGDGVPIAATGRMPGCLDGTASGCSGEWPALRFEFTDTSNEDAVGGPDLGYTWSQPLVGFLKLADGPDPGTDPDEVSVAIFGGGYDRATVTGNWIYIVDLETGKILLKRNVIGKLAGQVAATDLNLDGYFERLYWGTTDGKVWRMDVDIPGVDTDGDGRVDGVDTDGDGVLDKWDPYVLFDAGNTADPGLGPRTTNQPFFLEPKLVPITFDDSGYPVLAIALGSGNRDNLFFETSELNRFYLIVDKNDRFRVTEANLQAVAVDAPDTTSNFLNDPTLRGWYLVLNGDFEKVNTSALVVNQYVIFSTFSPSEVVVTNAGLCEFRGNARTYVVNLWNANPAGDERYVEHVGGAPPVYASEPVMYTGADGEIHVLQSLDDLQITEPVESWAIPLRVFSWKEN